MTSVFALIGAGALWLTYLWLGSAIICAYLSHRKGYGERPGLAAGLLLTVVGIVLWLVWPPKPESLWKTVGPFGSTVRADRDRAAGAEPPPPAAETPTRG